MSPGVIGKLDPAQSCARVKSMAWNVQLHVATASAKVYVKIMRKVPIKAIVSAAIFSDYAHAFFMCNA